MGKIMYSLISAVLFVAVVYLLGYVFFPFSQSILGNDLESKMSLLAGVIFFVEVVYQPLGKVGSIFGIR